MLRPTPSTFRYPRWADRDGLGGAASGIRDGTIVPMRTTRIVTYVPLELSRLPAPAVHLNLPLIPAPLIADQGDYYAHLDMAPGWLSRLVAKADAHVDQDLEE